MIELSSGCHFGTPVVGELAPTLAEDFRRLVGVVGRELEPGVQRIGVVGASVCQCRAPRVSTRWLQSSQLLKDATLFDL